MLANKGEMGEDAGMDYEAEGLLDGLKGDAREARARLLRELADDGFRDKDLRNAVRENRLALLPVDRALAGTLSANDIAERTGLPADTMVRIRRLGGLPEAGPEERVFNEEDIEAARSIKLFLDSGFDEDRIVEITQVLGEGVSRLAATITATFVETFLHPGDTEADVAARFAGLAQELTPAFGPILVSGFRAHLRTSVQRGMLGLAELQTGEAGRTQETAVCFADVVGFTRLGGEVDGRELGTVAARLAGISASLAEPPVRLVKTIGDAAMLVSNEPGPLVQAALKLIETFEEEELPTLRAGIAWGAAGVYAGDYYGNPVNLASRVTGVARPGSVLATREIRDRGRFLLVIGGAPPAQGRDRQHAAVSSAAPGKPDEVAAPGTNSLARLGLARDAVQVDDELEG
jgi:adenylate cyclase